MNIAMTSESYEMRRNHEMDWIWNVAIIKCKRFGWDTSGMFFIPYPCRLRTRVLTLESKMSIRPHVARYGPPLDRLTYLDLLHEHT